MRPPGRDQSVGQFQLDMLLMLETGVTHVKQVLNAGT